MNNIPESIHATRCTCSICTPSGYRNPKSKRGAVAQYNQIMRACRRDMSGGLSFGMDWPTLRSTFPERYERIQQLKASYAELPS